MFEQIPHELRALRQWVVWRLVQREGASKPTKVPMLCDGSRGASSIEPTDWSTFEQVCAAHASGQFSGIGFVFSDNDPYTGIDLDATDDTEVRERQKRVADHFQSYTEISPSGYGLHIITKGSVAHGLKHKAVEIYSHGRFFTMTGNVWRQAPIVDYSNDVTMLWNEVREWSQRAPLSHAVLGDAFEKQTDIEVYNACMSSRIGERFQRLWNGEWQGLTDERWGTPYPSASEADQALINYLQYFSHHRVQIQRMFLLSGMGIAFVARKGENRIDYLTERMINKAFDMTPADVDMDQLRNNVEAMRVAMQAPVAPNPQSFEPQLVETAGVVQASPYVGPPGGGVLDLVAGYIYNSSPFPIPEIALGGAIGLMAGIVAGSHKVGGLGLNVYAMIIAGTGQGKDAARAGATRLLDFVAADGLSLAPDFIGPSNFASGQGIIRQLSKNSCFVSFQDEIGIRLAQMADPRAAPAVQATRQMMLDLYSGSTVGMAGSAYADKEKSIGRIKSANISILASGTPSTIFDNLSVTQVLDGLLPRFTMIEYQGHKPAFNDNAHLHMPTAELVQALKVLCDRSLQSQNAGNKASVEFAEDAFAASREFIRFCTAQENTLDEIGKGMWSRAWAKTAKLASLAAVGVNPFAAMITLDQWNWAKAITVRETSLILTKFEKGEIGKNLMPTSNKPDHNARTKALAGVLMEYMDTRKVYNSYRVGPGAKMGDWQGSYRTHGLISETFLKQRLQSNKAFADGHDGPTVAIQKTIVEFKSTGRMSDVNLRAENMLQLFGTPPANAAIVYHVIASIDELRSIV